MFEITEEVKRNYNKRRASRRRIKNKRKICQKYPYGSCRNKWWINGINIDMLERDILRWILER